MSTDYVREVRASGAALNAQNRNGVCCLLLESVLTPHVAVRSHLKRQ